MDELYVPTTVVPLPGRRTSKGITDALKALRPGQSVLLPTSARSLLGLARRVEYLGFAKRGEFHVRSAGKSADGRKIARVWRLDLDNDVL